MSVGQRHRGDLAVGDSVQSIHLGAVYATGTPSCGPVAHGLHAVGLLRAAPTGLVAPGGISVSHEPRPHAPVRIGPATAVRAECRFIDSARRRAGFGISVPLEPDASLATTGEAVIAFPRRESQ